jgi:hypothetical protein
MKKFSFNKNNKLRDELEVKARNELAVKAQTDVCSWYELYEDSSKASGIALITKENYEIMTNLNNYGSDYAAPIIFAKYFAKDLDQVESETKMYWMDLVPKYYDTVVMNLSCPYRSDFIYFSLPATLNEFQENVLMEIDKQIQKYNSQQIFRLRVSCRNLDKPREYDSVFQMLDDVYRSNARTRKTPKK